MVELISKKEKISKNKIYEICLKIKNEKIYISFLLIILLLSGCSNNLPTFGKGVSIGFDPRTVGMQIDDTLMQKNLVARLTLTDKKYFLTNPGRSARWKNIFNWQSRRARGKIKNY